MGEYYVGLDIGGTKCAVLLAEYDGEARILEKVKFDTPPGGYAPAEKRLFEGIETVLAKGGVTPSAVRAIGVSCGGPLDAERGLILSPPNLPGWDEAPIVARLQARFGVPAFLENDANACALVEWRLGAGRGAADMVFLTMGTGMGAGIIANGRLLRGGAGMAGEAGHIRLAADGPVGYGKAGSFEGFASGGGIAQMARQLTREIQRAGRTPAWIRDGCGMDGLSAKVMAEYARRGDPDALGLFGRVGDMLGKGLAVLADILNPERIVIGSVFARCEDLLRPSMEASLRAEGLAQALEGLQVLPAQTGEAIGDYASVMVAVNGVEGDEASEAGVRPDSGGHPDRASACFERLFERYGALEVCREQIWAAYEMLRDCYRGGGKLLLAGNGGSCADCEHIAGELMKGFWLKRPLAASDRARINALTADLLPGAGDLLQRGLPTIALTGHPALSSAVQNDLDPSLAAAQQVTGYGRLGDVLMAISTSGNALNAALAVQTAKALGLKTIGLTGGTGGRLGALCDCAIIAPAGTPADTQEFHLPIYHALCGMLEAYFFDN